MTSSVTSQSVATDNKTRVRLAADAADQDDNDDDNDADAAPVCHSRSHLLLNNPTGCRSQPRLSFVDCLKAPRTRDQKRLGIDLQTLNHSTAASASKGAITSKIKHGIKLKTSPARLAQLLHNCCSPH